MYIYKYLPIFTTLLILSFVISCKLLTPDDTTPPEIQLTIAGGNEISRGVTLYLDINDDSKIDYVSVMIDDTTAITVESNFDTISFDVTPFADESEHILYVEVADKEGNIGESEKIDVIITEFPGWRIYNELDMDWLAAVAVDENGIVWIGSGWKWDGLYIFNPENETWNHLSIDNSSLQTNYITDIKVVDDSRVWLANDTHIIQYDLTKNSWISIVELPKRSETSRDPSAWSIAIDKNFNLWIGTHPRGLLFYNHIDFIPVYLDGGRVYDVVIASDGTVYGAPDEHVIFSISNNQVVNYNYFIGKEADFTCIAADSSGNIWVAIERYSGYKYDGSQWEEVYPDDIMCDPMCVTRDGILYTQARDRGLVAWDGLEWIYFDKFDSPFSDRKYYFDRNYYSSWSISAKSISEAPNGDIWMVAGGKLMRYRPSLGGYP